jgi:hypothetical protein
MGLRVTPAQYKAMTGKEAPSAARGRYGNRCSWYDGLYFQSDKELADYVDQKRLLKAGFIAGFLWQGKLVITEGTDKENRAVTYTPDIVVLNNDGTYCIREDKGHRTQVYINKLKEIRRRYPRIIFTEV